LTALARLRVLELAQGVAGEYCGKLISDFSAEVIKIEPPGGSPTRALGPFGQGAGRRETSGLFAYLNTNKASAVLDVETPAGAAALQGLLARIDAVIDDHPPGWLEHIGLAPNTLAQRHPRLVVCSITAYGQPPPEGRDLAEDLNVFHASGWGYHTPSAPDDRRPPLKGPGRFLASYETGLDAALCVVSALYGRGRTGLGGFIDISKQATMVSRIDYVIGQMVAGDMDVTSSRTALDLWGPAAIFACREGYVYLWLSDQAHWAGLRRLIGDPEWMRAFPDRWLEHENTPERVATCRKEIAAWLAAQDRNEVSARAQKLGVQLVPVNDASDLPKSPQYQFRRYFTEVDHPVLGRAQYPTTPYRLSVTPAQITSAAPTLGEHTGAVLAQLAAPSELDR